MVNPRSAATEPTDPASPSGSSPSTPGEEHSLRAELHLHTTASLDGFSTLDDVLAECRRKQIGLVAVTDHDAMGLSSEAAARFAAAGIAAVPGCEMTTDRGAHLLGLFVDRPLTGAPAEAIADHVQSQGGLLGIPHPFKPETGLLAVSSLDEPDTAEVVGRADFIERLNGDWFDPAFDTTIEQIASRFELPLVAGSDAHKPWEIGRLVTALPPLSSPPSAASLRTALRQTDPALLRLEGFVQRPPQARSRLRRLLSRLRWLPAYRTFIKAVPFAVKRFIRLRLYQHRYRAWQANPGPATYRPALERTSA